MRKEKLLRKFAPLFVLVVAIGWLAACNGKDDVGSGLDDGKDPDDNTPADQCSIDEGDWGTTFNVGEVVANWQMSGYMAPDGDYEVDQTDTQFTLEDVNCAGHKALVVLLGDSS